MAYMKGVVDVKRVLSLLAVINANAEIARIAIGNGDSITCYKSMHQVRHLAVQVQNELAEGSATLVKQEA